MTDTSTVNPALILEAIHLPPTPSFWPVAWGWWSLLGLILFSITISLLLWKWRKRRLRAKRAAIRLLALEREQITPSGAMEIVRQAVLSYYPRSRVAHLSGEEWLSFLDSQLKSPIFQSYGQEWLKALYQRSGVDNREALISQCDEWLNNALPPKRRGRG